MSKTFDLMLTSIKTSLKSIWFINLDTNNNDLITYRTLCITVLKVKFQPKRESNLCLSGVSLVS